MAAPGEDRPGDTSLWEQGARSLAAPLPWSRPRAAFPQAVPHPLGLARVLGIFREWLGASFRWGKGAMGFFLLGVFPLQNGIESVTQQAGLPSCSCCVRGLKPLYLGIVF